ncbi:MAG: integration host factor subunit beta [Legionellaceae bacterium]|nr:integration host factor subunit beta [Legionellaceae bacterium]
MIKSKLIANLAADMTHLPEKRIMEGVNLILETMSHSLTQGERIEIRGFGSFALRHRPPRNAHNPKTGEKVITKEKNTPHFKPGKELRARVEASRHTHPLQDDEST